MTRPRERRDHDIPSRHLTDRARSLVAEADVTDRATRFDLRLDAVHERSARRSRNGRRARWGIAVVLSAVAAAVGLAAAGPVGLVGVLLGPLVLGVRATLLAAAARRGASAWDWRTQRHTLMGDPSREVQALDDPRR